MLWFNYPTHVAATFSIFGTLHYLVCRFAGHAEWRLPFGLDRADSRVADNFLASILGIFMPHGNSIVK